MLHVLLMIRFRLHLLVLLSPAVGYALFLPAVGFALVLLFHHFSFVHSDSVL